MLNKDAKIIWLASYPKSGNTWVSLFLTALLDSSYFHFNRILIDATISARHIIDEQLGIYSANLPETDYLHYRSSLYEKWAAGFTKRDFLLCKVHDACIKEGIILFPPNSTRGTIYIMRNPFDMAASLANHEKISIAKAVNRLCKPDYGFAKRRTALNTQLSQHLGTWANHVQSWTQKHHQNLLLIKYENLISNPNEEFTKILNYLEMDYSPQEIQQALTKTTFKNLQQQETTTKFLLTPAINQFFRSGKTGGWREELTPAQVRQITDANYDALLQYQYIDESGNVLV